MLLRNYSEQVNYQSIVSPRKPFGKARCSLGGWTHELEPGHCTRNFRAPEEGSMLLSAVFWDPKDGNMLISVFCRVSGDGSMLLSAVFRAPEDGNMLFYAVFRAMAI